MYVEEINILVQALDISADDAIEIINIYFEFFSETWVYTNYLYENIRVVRDTAENQEMIAELETIDDTCLYHGDDYLLITNYKSLVDDGDIGDCIPNPF